MFIVNFGDGGDGVSLAVVVIGNNGNFGYSSSIPQIGCWLWASNSVSNPLSS